MDYYNEYEPYAVQWLRNLANADQIPPGVVDPKSILEVKAEDLAEYRRCHFFAGIAGWALALKLAGWPEDVPVWTGSCPCQPFSISGKKRGESDERHLWPTFRGLIEKRRPPVVFGEQVASPAGRRWLAGVRTDLEELGYRFGGSDLCAAGVGAPHIRQRLYWVADTKDSDGWSGIRSSQERAWKEEVWRRGSSFSCPDDGLGDTGSSRLEERSGGEVQQTAVRTKRNASTKAGPWSRFIAVSCTEGKTRRIEPGIPPLAYGVPARVGKIRAYGNAIVPQVAATFIKAYLETLRRPV